MKRTVTKKAEIGTLILEATGDAGWKGGMAPARAPYFWDQVKKAMELSFQMGYEQALKELLELIVAAGDPAERGVAQLLKRKLAAMKAKKKGKKL
jgi:hypothetical protein